MSVLFIGRLTVLAALLSSQFLLTENAATGTSGRILPAGSQLSTNVTGTTRSSSCSSNLFRCPSSGRCIPTSWLCDGDNDCGFSEDETDCAQKRCAEGEYKCESSNKCIPKRWLCDAEDDCGDSSDEHERNCANRTCEEGRFQCPNTKTCLPPTWVCDTQKDCPNGEDESNCTHSAECTSDEFKCRNGRCIFKRWKCDHDDDCGDGSDEPSDCEYTCGVAQIKCETDHRCIPQRWRCDGERDCPDGSDEKNCYGYTNRFANSTCRPYEFHCTNGVCIHGTWECDGDNDCPDGSDEEHCTNRTCTAEQYTCKTGSSVQCIPRAYRCNGANDCRNGEDEKDCPQTVATKACDPTREFDCGDNFCIGFDKVCNGHYDCPINQTSGFYADESPVRTCDKTTVDHCTSAVCDKTASCISTKFGAICACPKGYRRDNAKSNRTYLVCEDIDECNEKPKRCGQKCHNAQGTFTCGCHQGYMLSRDKVNCRALGEHPKLIYSHRTTIVEIDLHTKKARELIEDLESAVAMDYSYTKGIMVWSDVAEEIIYSLDLAKAGKSKDGVLTAKNHSKILVDDRLFTPDGLAVDWIHDLVYWTDTGRNTISVVTLEGKYRKTLIDDRLDEPRAIAIDPLEGLIFWTDWGKDAKIERASMDGTMRMTIVDKDIMWPNGLAVDLVDKRIFWADAKLKTIKSADYMGKNLDVVLTSASAVRHPFSLTVFEEKVYWTDWDTEGIHLANKYNGVTEPNPLTKGLVGPMAVRVYHEMSQPKGYNKCENSPCEQLCLPKWMNHSKPGMAGIPYTCQCGDDYHLDTDGLRCLPNGSLATPIKTLSGPEISPRVDDVKSSGRTAFVTVAFVGCIALVVAFIAFVVWRHVNKNRRRKGFTLENPVYRRTMVDGGNSSDHYDHLRLSGDSDRHYHPGTIGGSNGGVPNRGGSGVYQPTTMMSDDMVEPDSMGVGVIQNGKYSMKLPLTEHEEGPDYS